MNVDKNQLPLSGLLFEQVHHFFGVGGRKPRGRLVDKEDGRFPDQFQRHVQAFSLPAADHFFKRASHLQVAEGK